MRPFKSSLGGRIRLLVAASCLGLGLSTLLTFYLLTQWRIRESARTDVQSASSMLSSVIRGRSDLLCALSRFVATSPRVRDLTLTDGATVQDAIQSLRTDAGLDAMIVADGNGAVLGQDGFANRRVNPVVAGRIQRALAGESWTGVIEQDHALFVAACEPLKVGELVHGALATFVQLDATRTQHDLGSLAIAFVHSGRATGNGLGLTKVTPPPSGDSWQLSINGQAYVAQYAPLPLTLPGDEMGFVTLRPVAEIVGPYRVFTAAFITVFAALAIVTLLAGSAFGSSIARSLDGLVGAAQAIQKGEWPEPLTVKREDEVGLLQSAFNGMSNALQESQARLLSMIDLDPLTELDNHRRFKERLAYEASRTTGTGENLALLLIDIDRFAQFNQEYGHAVGDEALKAVAEAIKENVPEVAVTARYGGEEFAILLPDGAVHDVRHLFRQIQAQVTDLTLSGGCAELKAAKGKTDGLILAAEIALARAKQAGRGSVSDFETELGPNGDPTEVFRYLQDGSYATIKALAAAVDAKDPYTHGHSERVARYAADLAAFMGADAEEVDRVLRAGTLHDVGKIGVPDAILQKQGRLDDEEFRVMQAHPVLGELIAAKAPQLQELIPGIRHHHERFDGRGYPDALAGEAIPRIARFLAIADTFDAMTSDRPYRKGMAVEIALSEIAKGAGTQFDPEMAAAFVNLMDRPQQLAA